MAQILIQITVQEAATAFLACNPESLRNAFPFALSIAQEHGPGLAHAIRHNLKVVMADPDEDIAAIIDPSIAFEPRRGLLFVDVATIGETAAAMREHAVQLEEKALDASSQTKTGLIDGKLDVAGLSAAVKRLEAANAKRDRAHIAALLAVGARAVAERQATFARPLERGLSTDELSAAQGFDGLIPLSRSKTPIAYDEMSSVEPGTVLDRPSLMRAIERCADGDDVSFEATVIAAEVEGGAPTCLITAHDGGDNDGHAVEPKGVVATMLGALLEHQRRRHGAQGIVMSWTIDEKSYPNLDVMTPEDIARVRQAKA